MGVPPGLRPKGEKASDTAIAMSESPGANAPSSRGDNYADTGGTMTFVNGVGTGWEHNLLN